MSLVIQSLRKNESNFLDCYSKARIKTLYLNENMRAENLKNKLSIKLLNRIHTLICHLRAFVMFIIQLLHIKQKEYMYKQKHKIKNSICCCCCFQFPYKVFNPFPINFQKLKYKVKSLWICNVVKTWKTGNVPWVFVCVCILITNCPFFFIVFKAE